MSARPIMGCRRRRRPRPTRFAVALNDRLREVETDRTWADRVARRRDSGPPRQSLLRLTATARSCVSSRRTIRVWRCMPTSAGSPSAWHSTQDNLYVCVGGMGLYRVTPERNVEKVTDETNRSLLFGHRRQPVTAWPTISTSPMTAVSSSPKPPCGTRCTNGRSMVWRPRQRPDHLLRSEYRNDDHTALRGSDVPQWHLYRQRRQSILFAETLGCSIKRYWFDGPKTGQSRDA